MSKKMAFEESTQVETTLNVCERSSGLRITHIIGSQCFLIEVCGEIHRIEHGAGLSAWATIQRLRDMLDSLDTLLKTHAKAGGKG